MTTHTLHEWLADPLFAAAEDVQESADRLESNFRTWKQENQDDKEAGKVVEHLRVRLLSACDTLKWQLEVFERAVRSEGSLQSSSHVEESSQSRRQEFVDVIRLQLCAVEALVRGSEEPCPSQEPDLGVSQQAPSPAEVPMRGGNGRQGNNTDPRKLPPHSSVTELSESCSSHIKDKLSHSSSPAMLSLSGFLGVPSPKSVPTRVGPSKLGRELRAGVDSCAAEQNEASAASENSCPPGLRVSDEDGSMQSPSSLAGDQSSPGPECKSFPSLAHMRGAQQGLQGWQCLLSWTQHFQRMSRRRMLENLKGSEENLTQGSLMVKTSSDTAAVSHRLEAAQVLPVSRTSSVVNLSAMDQGKRAEWHMHIPSNATSLPGEEQCMKTPPARRLAGRPRRLNTIQRPGRPLGSLILVCAAAVLMIAATVCSQYAGAQVFDRRNASLLEIPTMQANSPAFP